MNGAVEVSQNETKALCGEQDEEEARIPQKEQPEDLLSTIDVTGLLESTTLAWSRLQVNVNFKFSSRIHVERPGYLR
eukprot:g77988.t1